VDRISAICCGGDELVCKTSQTFRAVGLDSKAGKEGKGGSLDRRLRVRDLGYGSCGCEEWHL
jgi:hypothetical protein